MADISKITPPGSQTTYNLKDATAREQTLIVADQTTQYNHVPVKTETKTLGAVTFVANAVTGVVNVNGNNTSGSYQDYELPVLTLAAGTYKMLSYSGVSASTIVGFILKSGGTTIATEWGNEGVFTLAAPATITPVIRAWNGANINNVNVKPFVILESLYDAGFTDFQPYALPNTKITPELIELVDSGAKNIFNEPVLTTGSAGEINITDNGDGTFTLNTSGATTVNSGVRIGWFTAKQGVTYAVSNYSSLCQLRVRYGSDIILDTSGGTNTFVAPSNAKAELIWYIAAGTTLTNYLLKPMVCTKSTWDVSQKFVPYRPTYEETVEQVAENENNISSLLLSDTGKTGDLNDVTATEFAVYTDQSAHLPTQSFYYVRTTTNSSAVARLQEAFEMVTAKAYVRTYAGDMWSAWLEITNPTT